jgi:hypothetical protein
MPITLFHGLVFPPGVVTGKSGAGSWADPIVAGVKFSFDITDSVVLAHCETHDVNQVPLKILHRYAYLMVRGALDAYSFVHGQALTFVLNDCTQPNGQREHLLVEESVLANICTVSVGDIFRLAHAEGAILKHLHDLVDTILEPLESEINCARAVDGFARLLLPGKGKDSARWQRIRAALNLSQAYITFITDLSAGPRHGSVDPQSLPDIVEARRRSWVIANRFLEFRKRGSINLAAPDFPLL